MSFFYDRLSNKQLADLVFAECRYMYVFYLSKSNNIGRNEMELICCSLMSESDDRLFVRIYGFRPEFTADGSAIRLLRLRHKKKKMETNKNRLHFDVQIEIT